MPGSQRGSRRWRVLETATAHRDRCYPDGTGQEPGRRVERRKARQQHRPADPSSFGRSL